MIHADTNQQLASLRQADLYTGGLRLGCSNARRGRIRVSFSIRRPGR